MLSGLIDTVNITVLVAGPYGWWLLVHMDGGTYQYEGTGYWSIWMVVAGPYGWWHLSI